MFGSTVLEILIGLALVYFLLSLVCSALNEAIAQMFGTRARYLLEGLRGMLSESSINLPGSAAGGNAPASDLGKLFRHPLIQDLGRKPGTLTMWDAMRTKYESILVPAYIPSRTFALALLDTVAPAAQKTVTPDPHMPNDRTKDVTTYAPVQSFDQIRESIVNLPESDLRRALLTCIDTANYDLEKARKNVEQWFDSSMERVSGWYKRNSQVLLLCIGFSTAVALNVDTFKIANTLWRSPELRSDMVKLAQSVNDNIAALEKAKTSACKTAAAGEECKAATAKWDDARNPDVNKSLKDVGKLSELGLPIGWDVCHDGNPESNKIESAPQQKQAEQCVAGWKVLGTDYRIMVPENYFSWLAKILGLLFTAAAISFGAPFWFDLMNKLLDLRGSRPKPRN